MTKLDRLREKLEENKADAIIIDSPYNRRYLTNFTGTAGTALITADKALFITDFRYTEQAAEQAAAFEIIEHKQGMIQEIANQIDKLGVKRLAFEKNYTTYSQFETYQNQFSQELIPVEGIVEALRMIKTPDELEIMKKAAKIADDAFAHIQSFIEPGVKEIDISNELEFFMRRQGATSSSFDTIVASGLRSALPHGVASDKQMAEGELVTLDYGALYEGYCSDITRTVAVGEISAALREIYDIVLEANLRGVKGTKAGMSG